MTPDAAAIRTYFAKLGLETEIAELYLALHTFGPQSMSALSRSSHVERTRIYRLIDQLMDSGLVEIEPGYGRGILKAAPIANLRILINKRAVELQGLQDELQMVEQLLGRNSLSSPAFGVHMYQGNEGIKQMFWNIQRDTIHDNGNEKSDIVMLLHENMRLNASSRFFERWAAACNKKELQFRAIIPNSATAHNPIETAPQTSNNKSSAVLAMSEAAQTHIQHWQARVADTNLPAAAHGTVVYDDVTAYFGTHESDVFGMELRSSSIADSQRYYFELLWDSSTHS